MPTPTDPLTWLRDLCASLGGVVEVVAWGHPNFRVGGRTFTVFEVYRGKAHATLSLTGTALTRRSNPPAERVKAAKPSSPKPRRVP